MPVGATPVPDRREVSERLVRASGAVAGIPVEPGRYLRRGDPVDPAGSKRGQELTVEIDPEDLQRRWPVGAYLRGHERLGEFLEGQLDRRSRWLSENVYSRSGSGGAVQTVSEHEDMTGQFRTTENLSTSNWNRNQGVLVFY